MRSFFWSVFPCVWTEYRDLHVNLRIQSKYRKIRTRKNSVFGHFSRSAMNNKIVTSIEISVLWCNVAENESILLWSSIEVEVPWIMSIRTTKQEIKWVHKNYILQMFTQLKGSKGFNAYIVGFSLCNKISYLWNWVLSSK